MAFVSVIPRHARFFDAARIIRCQRRRDFVENGNLRLFTKGKMPHQCFCDADFNGPLMPAMTTWDADDENQ